MLYKGMSRNVMDVYEENWIYCTLLIQLKIFIECMD